MEVSLNSVSPSLVACSLILLTAGLPRAATLVVDCAGESDFISIQAGIDAASPGDTVLVTCGTYTEHDIVMKPGVSVVSETGSADCVTIDAEGQGRVLYCQGAGNETNIVGLTLTNGEASSGGGLYCWDHSSPTIENCTFTDNSATRGGGLLCYFASSPSLTGVVFEANTARTGGGMECDTGCSPMLAQVSFSGNSATLSGGGLRCVNDSSPTLVDASFTLNTSVYGAGMECESDSSPQVTGGGFTGNTASEQGGAVYCQDYSRPRFEEVAIVENECTGRHGGGISCVDGSKVILSDSVVQGNVAYNVGGGLYCDSAAAELSRCTMTTNSAHMGGAVGCESGGSVTLLGGSLGENSAFYGGAIYLDSQSSAFLDSVDVIDNTAGGWGGGIWADGSSLGVLTDVILSGNAAEQGGALWSWGFSSFQLSRSVLVGNSAVNRGGAFACQWDGGSSFTSCTLCGNSAPDGSAIHARAETHPLLSHTVVAFGVGGDAIVCVDDGLVTLSCSDVYGNDGGDWTGCISDQLGIDGNISADPLFCDYGLGDFTIQSDSPCAPDSNPECGLVGAFNVGCPPSTGMHGSAEEVSWGSIKAMFR